MLVLPVNVIEGDVRPPAGKQKFSADVMLVALIVNCNVPAALIPTLPEEIRYNPDAASLEKVNDGEPAEPLEA